MTCLHPHPTTGNRARRIQRTAGRDAHFFYPLSPPPPPPPPLQLTHPREFQAAPKAKKAPKKKTTAAKKPVRLILRAAPEAIAHLQFLPAVNTTSHTNLPFSPLYCRRPRRRRPRRRCATSLQLLYAFHSRNGMMRPPPASTPDFFLRFVITHHMIRSPPPPHHPHLRAFLQATKAKKPAKK